MLFRETIHIKTLHTSFKHKPMPYHYGYRVFRLAIYPYFLGRLLGFQMSPELTKIFNEGVISSTQAGKDFDITNDYVTLLCRRGKVEGFIVGRLWFVQKKSLESYLNKSKLEREARYLALSKQMRAQRAAAQTI